MARRSSAELRTLVVQAGLTVLYERGLRATASHVPMTEALAVLEASHGLSLSMGSIFGKGRLWRTVKEFQLDLLKAALDDHAASGPTDESMDLVHQLPSMRGQPFEERQEMLVELCRIGGNLNGFVPFDPKRRTWTLWVAIWAMAMSDLEAGEHLLPSLENEERHAIDSFSRLYGVVLDRLGLRIRPPYEIGHLSLLAAALTNGIVLRAGITPDETQSVPSRLNAGDWNLLGVGLAAFAMELIEDDVD